MIAFSGGADSAFLLAAAYEVLKENVVAVTAKSPIHSEREKKDAILFAGNLGAKHIIIKSGEMNQPGFIANGKDRCYICKKNLFKDFLRIASELGIKYVAHGANMDDQRDFRPGHRAANEMGIIAPLVDAGLTKKDIRQLSKEMDLITWNKPAMACLATRIPYGTSLTEKTLNMVEQAENIISSLGFNVCRVRHHGDVARIEIDREDFAKLLTEKNIRIITDKFRKIGFLHIALDLEGYIRGSMNRSIKV